MLANGTAINRGAPIIAEGEGCISFKLLFAAVEAVEAATGGAAWRTINGSGRLRTAEDCCCCWRWAGTAADPPPSSSVIVVSVVNSPPLLLLLFVAVGPPADIAITVADRSPPPVEGWRAFALLLLMK